MTSFWIEIELIRKHIVYLNNVDFILSYIFFRLLSWFWLTIDLKLIFTVREATYNVSVRFSSPILACDKLNIKKSYSAEIPLNDVIDTTLNSISIRKHVFVFTSIDDWQFITFSLISIFLLFVRCVVEISLWVIFRRSMKYTWCMQFKSNSSPFDLFT